MVNYYLVYMKLAKKQSGYKKWPIVMYRYEDETYIRLDRLEDIRNWLENNNKIYYKDQGKKMDMQPMLKSQILTIIGPIPFKNNECVPIEDVYTLNEAAKLWGLSDGSTIRKAIERGKFYSHEVKKSEATWLITRTGMLRYYGPANEDEFPRIIVNEIYYDQETGQFKTRLIL